MESLDFILGGIMKPYLQRVADVKIITSNMVNNNLINHENEIQNLVVVYDDILKEMSKSAVRYSEVKDNLEYLDEHVKVINEEQEKLQNHLIQLREDEAEAEDNLLKIQSKNV